MRKECEASPKPGQAALIVTYGAARRTYYPLEGDLIVLGRAPTCDITLVSPEVAAVHCILQRGPNGWHLRDCSGGRHATRLNGRLIHEEALHDTDVLQIGAFSFEVRLPSGRATPVLGNTPVVDGRLAARWKQLQRSRRNLVRLALRLRRKALQANPLPPALAELERQAQCLRDLQRDYETRLKQCEQRLDELEKAERELCDERAAFERECTERRAQLDQAEHDLAQREVEAVATASSEWAKMLDRRSQELDCFAQYLRRCQRQLLEQMEKPREEIRSASQGTVRASGIRERLAQLHKLKEEIVGTSPSAPGDQLRADREVVTANPERSVVADTAGAGS